MDYSVSYYDTSSADMMLGALGVYMSVVSIISLIVSIVVIIATWKLMTKAGKPGWASLIPIYNTYQLFDIVYPGNGIRFLFLLIPFYNIYVSIKYYIDMAKAFGQHPAFAIGLIFLGPIFTAILGFGPAEYQWNRNSFGNGNLKQRTERSRDEAMEFLRQQSERRQQDKSPFEG